MIEVRQTRRSLSGCVSYVIVRHGRESKPESTVCSLAWLAT